MRKALVIGIDYYQHGGGLYGCVGDAHGVNSVLTRNADGTVNFDVKLVTSSSESDPVTREDLRGLAEDLFNGDAEIAFFYFAGHGHIEATGGYILGSDSAKGNDGVALADIVHWANESSARNKVIVLDSCHAGIAGSRPGGGGPAEIKEGVTILTASTDAQYASEENGQGVFTSLFVDALSGAAANLLGDITPGSVYAHIDQSLGPWEQRPVFKTNVKSFVSLRTVQPTIDLADLHRITEFFPTPGHQFALDPTYEPERNGSDVDLPEPDRKNNEIFAILQKFNRVNLVVPVDAPHMWHAAMQSKSCKLTALGEHYRRLVEKKRI